MILDADTENQSVDIPAEAPEYEVAVRNKVAEAFRARRPEPPTGRMGMERAGESAAGALISAFGGAPIAESLSYLAHHIKKARILSKLPVAGKLFDAQMEITENLGREWALGAKRVSDQLLPTEQQKGDIYERGGSFAGGLVALPAIAEQFGALGVAALGAGQAGAPAYFETLQKTGDETKAIRAMLPALGVGATYAVPAAKILGGLNKASGGLLSSELFRLMFAAPAAEGALAVGQSAALDAIMEHATGEDRKFLQDGIEQGAFGFATTFVFGLLGAGKARLAGRAAEAPGAPAAEAAPQAHVEAPSEAAGVGGHPPSAEQQEAAKRFLAKPETKEGPLGVPDEIQEALRAAGAAEKAAGRHVPEKPPPKKRWPMGTKPSLAEPIPDYPEGGSVEDRAAEERVLDDRLTGVGRDYKVPHSERVKAFDELGATPAGQKSGVLKGIFDRWGQEGMIPQQVEEPAPIQPESAQAKRNRLEEQRHARGVARGEPEAETEAAKRSIRAMPRELMGLEIGDLQKAYESANRELDALGPEPHKPSNEQKRFGKAGREGAPPENVAAYDAEVAAHNRWKRQYAKLKRREVEASNELFKAKQSQPEETYYHVSGKGSEIEKSGELRASKEGVNQGGLGGITEEPGVSVTTKREKAELYQKELDRLRDLSNAATQDEALDLLRRFRDEDARLDPGVATEAYQEAIAKAKHQVSKGADPLDATFNAYRDEYLRRRGAGNFQGGKHPGLENPNLIGERSGFKGNEPARIFEVQKGQIPEGHKISKGQDEGELRIGGDVPLGGRAVSAEEVRMTSGVLKGRKNDIVELYAGGPSPFRNVTTKSVLALAKRNLISTGDTPRTARRELELAHGAVKAELAEATRHARKLDVEARKAFGRDWANGKGGQQIKDALENSDLIRDLPENMRRPVALLREHLDRLSRRLIETGAAKGPMVGIIERNLGEYVTKAHQAYTDPEWADKVPEDVRNRLFSLWKSWSMPISKGELGVLEAASKQEGEAGRLAQMELAGRKDFLDMSEDEIRGEMDAILQRAKEHADNPFAHIASGKLGRKDLSIFKHRKTIPKELHDFLGEVNSPIAAYANSVVKMAGVAAKHEAFTAIRRTGLGSFLHEKPTGKFTARLSADGNAGLRPLDGLYTTPEIKKALTEIGPGEQHALIKLALKANAVVRWGKVVGQPWATVRNLLGNFPTMVANGHLPWVGMESWKKAFSKGDLGELKEAIKLGVIGDAISTYELSDVREMLKKAPTDLGQDKSALASVKGMAERLFAAGDIGPKLSAWAQEWKALVKAGMSEPAAKELAADRIRDTMPTPERMAPFLKKWRGQPVLGNYFAFSSEIIRNLGNRMRLIGSELKSPNPKIRAMGYKRVAGQLAALTVVPAAVYAYNSLNGIDSEEDADRRNFVPPWDKESRLVWSGTKKKGRYFDLSDVDPMMTFADPVARMLQGEDPTEAGLAAVKEYAQRVFGLSPIAQVAVELYSSRDKNGAPIKDVAAYLNKNLSPGFALSYQRGNENGFGPEVAAAASGVRSYDFDPEKSLKYKAFAFQDEIRKVSMQINDLKDRRDLDPDEKRSLRKMAESERKALFKGLHEMSRSAIRLGIPIYKVEDTLDATLSEDVTDAILSGYYIPYGEKE